jgi:predicted dithiol-disulfide oxidoreductase (DUF899 family)
MVNNATPTLIPATVLAAKNQVSFPNESDDYRRARQALLVEEIELRRHIERVAEQRRALPPGGEVTGDYRFEGEKGPVRFVDLFGERQSLAVYSYMFGPQRERPCPMCTSLLSSWDGGANDVYHRAALAVVARSRCELVSEARLRGGFSDPLALVTRRDRGRVQSRNHSRRSHRRQCTGDPDRVLRQAGFAAIRRIGVGTGGIDGDGTDPESRRH